tara:strand:- start:2201 stop:5428 length:3228 start_codon:yes stop_codon:yes gene_type:complete
MASLSSQLGNFASILPQVMIKRIIVTNTDNEDLINLKIRLLVRDVATDSDQQMLIDIIRNNAVVCLEVFDSDQNQGYKDAYYYPSSPQRVSNARRGILRRDFFRNDRRLIRRKVDVGSLLRGTPVESDVFLNSGAEVYDFTTDYDIQVASGIQSLQALVYVHLDILGVVDSMEEYSGVNLDFAEGHLNAPYNIGTNAKCVTILQDNKVPDFSMAMIDQNSGQVWTGEYHEMRDQEGNVTAYMDGATHDESTGIFLAQRRVRNTKTLDNRSTVNNQTSGYYGGTYETERVPLPGDISRAAENALSRFRQERASNSSRGFGTPSPRERITNSLFELSAQNATNESIGDLFMSVNNHKDVNIIFNINWLEVLKRKSDHYHLFPHMTPEEVDVVIRLTSILKIDLMRREVSKERSGTSKFLSRTRRVLNEEAPVRVSSTYPMASATGLHSVHRIVPLNIDYQDADPVDMMGISSFTGKDTTIKNEIGVFQYYVEYEFIDGFSTFFKNFFETVETAQRDLERFIQIATIPVSFYTSEAGQRITDDTNGNYNPETGEFTEQFRNSRDNEGLIEQLMDVFATMDRFVNVDHPSARSARSFMLLDARRMINPRTATLDTMVEFQNSFMAYFTLLRSKVKEGKTVTRSHTSRFTPQDNLKVLKHVDFSDTFFNTDTLNKMFVNLFDFNVDDPSGELIADLVSAVEAESTSFGFSTNQFADGVYLSPNSFQFSPDIVPDMFVPAETKDFVNGPEDTKKIMIKGKSSNEHNILLENTLDKAFAMIGKPSIGAPGLKNMNLPHIPKTSFESAMFTPRPEPDSVYNGVNASFFTDVNTSFTKFGLVVDIDQPSTSISSLLADIPFNDLGQEQSLEMKFEVLKKLTQNHIDQLKNQKSTSIKSEELIDANSVLSLDSFAGSSSDILGFLRTVSSLDSQGQIINGTEVRNAQVDISPEERRNIPPQLRAPLVLDRAMPGVLEDGSLSRFRQGMMFEVKQVGSRVSGMKSASTQAKINSDLGRKNENTRGNLNKINFSSLKPMPSGPTGLNTGKKYRICKLIPYERKQSGIIKGDVSEEVAIANEYFLVEV